MMVSYFASCTMTLLLTTTLCGGEVIRSSFFDRKGGEDVQLAGLSDDTIQVESLTECASSCLEEEDCLSFNFGPIANDMDRYDCVHNLDVADDSGISLSQRRGYTYYEKVSAEINADSGPKAVAYNSVTEDFYYCTDTRLMRYSNWGFSDPSGVYALPLYKINGLVARSEPGNAQTFDVFLDDGTAAPYDLDLLSGAWSTVSPFQSMEIVYGSGAPDYVDDVVSINDTYYFILEDKVHNDPHIFHFHDHNANNIFYGAPLQITAATELWHPYVVFYRGPLAYTYNLETQKVSFGLPIRSNNFVGLS